MGFSRQEYWSGLLFPSLGDLPNPGVQPRSPALQADALTSEPQGKLLTHIFLHYSIYIFCHCLVLFWTSYKLYVTLLSVKTRNLKRMMFLPYLLSQTVFSQVDVFLLGLPFSIPVGTKGKSLLKSHLEVDCFDQKH